MVSQIKTPAGGNTEIGSVPSGVCQMFVVVVTLVVVLGVVAQKLNEYRKSPSVCGWRRCV